MAKVWSVSEGYPNALGDPWAVLALDDAIRVLDLKPEGFLMDLSSTPKFGNPGRNVALAGYQHVLIEICEDEAAPGWRPGYYKSPLSPGEAFLRLQVHQRLGENWRDEWKRGQDADGEPAIWLWAVLRAGAPDTEWAGENRERILTEVREVAAESGIPDWVYVRFRKEKDERVAP